VSRHEGPVARPDPSEGRRRRRPQHALRVNPIACDAHGVCIELLPELISADPWGYPIMPAGPVPRELLPLARRAVADCPTLALLLTEIPTVSRT
jgi:ferredoxin